LSLTQIAIELC